MSQKSFISAVLASVLFIPAISFAEIVDDGFALKAPIAFSNSYSFKLSEPFKFEQRLTPGLETKGHALKIDGNDHILFLKEARGSSRLHGGIKSGPAFTGDLRGEGRLSESVSIKGNHCGVFISLSATGESSVADSEMRAGIETQLGLLCIGKSGIITVGPLVGQAIDILGSPNQKILSDLGARLQFVSARAQDGRQVDLAAELKQVTDGNAKEHSTLKGRLSVDYRTADNVFIGFDVRVANEKTKTSENPIEKALSIETTGRAGVMF